MVKDTRYKLSFIALDDTGERHRLHVFVEILDVSSRDDPSAEMEGLMSIRTDSGGAVNRLERGQYLIVAGGLRLHSDDPVAP